MTVLEQQLVHLHRLTRTSDLAALPLEIRVLDRLTDVLVLSHELLSEFQTEDANRLLWLEPHIRRVYDEVDQLIRRFAQ